MLYRIVTELKNKDRAAATLSALFDGFSLIEATGSWNDLLERSLIIEVETDESETINVAALKIKSDNDQEVVMI
jgi:hypothetical protein